MVLDIGMREMNLNVYLTKFKMLWILILKTSPKIIKFLDENIRKKIFDLELGKHFQFSSVQSLSRVWLFMTSWNAARQAFLSITNSQSILKLMSVELLMHSTFSSSIVPFSSLLQSFPASVSFQMSQYSHQVVKVLEFQLQHQSFKWILRTDFL